MKARTARRPIAIAVAATLAVAAGAGTAAAHLKFSPLETSRYVKLEIDATGVRLVYSIGPGERPALALLRAADTNGDGTIGGAEGPAFLDREAGRVSDGLRLAVDGAVVRAGFGERNLGLSDPRVAAVPFAIDLVERLSLASLPEGALHTISLDDATLFPSPGEMEVRVEESADIELVETKVGGRPAPSARSATFATVARPDEKRDVMVTFRLRPGVAARASGLGWRTAWLGLNPIALLAAGAFAGVAGGLAWRRERRRARPPAP